MGLVAIMKRCEALFVVILTPSDQDSHCSAVFEIIEHVLKRGLCSTKKIGMNDDKRPAMFPFTEHRVGRTTPFNR